MTEEIAEAALRLIDVEYDVLPAVFDAEAAMQPDAPLVHDGGSSPGGNAAEGSPGGGGGQRVR